MEKVVADKPRHSLEGLVGTPIPRHSVHTLKHTVPRTEQHWGPRAAPQPRARRDGPSPPPARLGEGGGAAAGGRGAFVFLTHLSRQLVGGWGGRIAVGPLLSPPLCLPHSHHPHPPAIGTVGWRRGRTGKLQGHSTLPPGPRLPRLFQLSTQGFNPGVGGPRDPGIFVLPQPPSKLLGSPEGGASAGCRTGLDPP